MATAVLVRGGPQISLVRPDGRVEQSWPIDKDAERAAAIVLSNFAEIDLRHLLPHSRDLHQPRALSCADPQLSQAITKAGGSLAPISILELRSARENATRASRSEERAFFLALARASARAILASPEEALISLAREEERLEKSLGRERNAAEQFVLVEVPRLQPYGRLADAFRAEFTRHHASLMQELDKAAREVVPNLAELTGPKVAARLVAHAGGVAALARMTAARLQLLGARRRPSQHRGPRYGVLFLAARMGDVPASRTGAYARSLAALAAIAARADAYTQARLGPALIARRDRRVERLRRDPR